MPRLLIPYLPHRWYVGWELKQTELGNLLDMLFTTLYYKPATSGSEWAFVMRDDDFRSAA